MKMPSFQQMVADRARSAKIIREPVGQMKSIVRTIECPKCGERVLDEGAEVFVCSNKHLTQAALIAVPYRRVHSRTDPTVQGQPEAG